MTTHTNKTFDCVGMKRQIQQKLLDEYEAVADRYESYWHFLQATGRTDPRVQQLRRDLRLPTREAE